MKVSENKSGKLRERLVLFVLKSDRVGINDAIRGKKGEIFTWNFFWGIFIIKFQNKSCRSFYE